MCCNKKASAGMQHVVMVKNPSAKKVDPAAEPPAEVVAENIPQAPAGEILPTDQPREITADRSDPAPRNKASR